MKKKGTARDLLKAAMAPEVTEKILKSMDEVAPLREGEEVIAKVPTRYKVVHIDHDKKMVVLKTKMGHLFHLDFKGYFKNYKRSDD